jgi:hypothetical protein
MSDAHHVVGRIAAGIPRHPTWLPKGLRSGLSAVTREALEHHGRLDCGRGSLEWTYGCL